MVQEGSLMKCQPELFNAYSLHNDTKLLFKLKLILGTVCAYGGEVPLSIKELSNRLKTSVQRTRLLLKKLEVEGVIHYETNDKLFFDRYQYVQTKEESTKEDLYSKNFVFFTCDEFLSEERNVQRFVLHAVGYKLVYLPGTYYWENVDALYGELGMLNIRTPKEALEIVEKAKKYLHIRLSKTKRNFQITGVKEEWLKMGEIHSEGSLLWVSKQLAKHHFCMEFVSSKALIQLAKVMEYYYAQFGYAFSTQVFDISLANIQQDPSRSHRFYEMIYQEDKNYSEEELDEISAYFRSVMRASELSYAVELNQQLQAHQETKKSAELQLFDGSELEQYNNELLKTVEKRINLTSSKLALLQKSWRKRVQSEPEWLINNKALIFTLPIGIFFELRREITHNLEPQDDNDLDNVLPF